MIHDDLDILQIFDEVNIKRITLIQCFDGLLKCIHVNDSSVPLNRPTDLPRRKPRSPDVPTVTSYSSDGLGALTTGRRCTLSLLPEKDFLQPVASLSPLSGPDLGVISPERPSPTTFSKRHSPATPLCHFLSATLLGFSQKFLAHITYGHRFSVSFHNSISNRTGIFVSFVLCYNPDFWNSA